MNSTSSDGRSRISIEFGIDQDIDVAANDIRDRISGVLDNLPEEADPPEVEKADSNDDVIMWLNLAGENMTVPELSDYADRYLVDRFSAVDGVARVRVGGSRNYALRVWIDRRKLAARNLAISDIEGALRRENIEAPAGTLESEKRIYTLRLNRAFRSADDFANLVISEGSDGYLFISASIREVYTTLAIAVALVTLVIFLFLGSLRATIIPAITVPISLTATFIVLLALGLSINLLTLLALVLAIGLVVDDAIVVLENIVRRINEYGETPLVAAYRGTRQVGFAVVATTLVLIAVFVPITFLQGDIGRLFREFALTIVGASYAYMERYMDEIERRLLPYTESQDGKPEEMTRLLIRAPGFGGNSYNGGFVIVVLNDWSQRRPADQIIREVNAKLSDLPGIRAFARMRQGLGGGTGKPVQFVLGGPSYEKLAEWRETFVQALEDNNPGILDIDWDYKETQPQYRIEINYKRAADLGVTVDDIGALGDVLDAMQKTARDVLPQEASIDFKGQSLDFKTSGSSIIFVFATGLVIVFLVLAAQFESYRHPIIIILTVPATVAGGLLGLWLTGNSLNIYTQIGLIMLIGLAAKNGILIVEFANQLRDEGVTFDNAIKQSAMTRFRPIVMTALTTAAGAIPLLTSSGAGSETRAAIGVVILSGVIAAGIVCVLFVPTAYALIARGSGSPKDVARKLEAEAQGTPDKETSIANGGLASPAE